VMSQNIMKNNENADYAIIAIKINPQSAEFQYHNFHKLF
jgi:hypothetical protein